MRSFLAKAGATKGGMISMRSRPTLAGPEQGALFTPLPVPHELYHTAMPTLGETGSEFLDIIA